MPGDRSSCAITNPAHHALGMHGRKYPVRPSRDNVWAAARPTLAPGWRDGVHEHVTGVHALQTGRCDLERLSIGVTVWMILPPTLAFPGRCYGGLGAHRVRKSSLVLGRRQNSTVVCPSWRNPYRVRRRSRTGMGDVLSGGKNHATLPSSTQLFRGGVGFFVGRACI